MENTQKDSFFIRIVKQPLFWLLLAFFVFFVVISCWSPVAGDDWGYALAGSTGNPFSLTFEHYLHWSGRVLAEFWGYCITWNKWLWNILNPCIFVGILYALIKNACAKRNPLFSGLLAIALMLSVTTYVRAQTYTWMMGTTYIVPLLGFLWYLYLIQKVFLEKEEIKNGFLWMALLNLTIPLWMENAAAIVVGCDVLVLIYLWFTDKKQVKNMFLLLVLGTIATCVIKFAPGAQARLVTTQTEWVSMSLLQQLRYNWVPFLRFTFCDNLWLTRVLSIVGIVFVLWKKDEYPYAKWHRWILVACFSWGILQTFSWNLYEWTGIQLFYNLCDVTWIYYPRIQTIFYGLWTCALLYTIFTYLKGTKKWFIALVFLCAGGANLVMMLSPIFDARSSIYTIYLLILVVLLFLEELPLQKREAQIGIVGTGICVLLLGSQYIQLYQRVNQVTKMRQEYIEYYRENPDITEGVMPAYPELSIHSGNITDDDTYHQESFRAYYGLNPDLKLTFVEMSATEIGQ